MPVNQDRSPLFEAQNASRYERQRLISDYEALTGCRLAVMIDDISGFSITLFQELIYDANPREDLHVMLVSPGGDGEAAVRLVRSMQSRCRELTIIIPTEAKSAATLLALGAHHILMTPFSDLGPVDPQLWDGENLVAAKDIVAAVDNAIEGVLAEPATAPIYDRLLSDLTAVIVQEARAALGSSYTLLGRALLSNPDRTMGEFQLYANLKKHLIDLPQSHADLFSADSAEAAGLSVIRANLDSEEWAILWRLWTRYFSMGARRIYEGRNASVILTRGAPE